MFIFINFIIKRISEMCVCRKVFKVYVKVVYSLCIRTGHNNDPKRITLQEKRDTATLTQAEFQEEVTNLLRMRNSQHSKFVTHSIDTPCECS